MTNQQYQILIVDDVPDNAFMIGAFLESEGYSVDTTDSASNALKKMKVSLPELVLLDVMMPGIDGYELTRMIRRDSTLRFTPIILITAHPEACRIKGLSIGATDFVRKPIDFEDLLSKIETSIKFKRTTR